MMSSFFSLPASQKKRKRIGSSAYPEGQPRTRTKSRRARSESISGSEISDNDAVSKGSNNSVAAGDENSDEEEELEDEDPAAKRIRLAQQYLVNTQKEVLDEIGFDAAEIDQENLRRRMGDRLKEDTAESKGKLYRWIADDVDWVNAKRSTTRVDGKGVTGVALHGRYAYTASKDMAVTKWELSSQYESVLPPKARSRTSWKPRRILYTRGNAHRGDDRDFQHHHRAILCIAVSPDGKFVATGGADKKLIIWDSETLHPLKIFLQHRDWVTSLAFRRGTNQMYSASKDRTVKIWSLDELAYVDTLFGHQDEVVDVSALTQENCVTVGARDRTARLWKVVDESQLVFRGGGQPGKSKDRRPDQTETADGISMLLSKTYSEGSMDRVACVDDETFVTGSDNGSLSIWNIHKKKPVFTLPLAHGVDPPPPIESASAEVDPDEANMFREPSARWITALKAVPFSNILLSGSWDGHIRIWRISPDKRKIEPLGPLGCAETSLGQQILVEQVEADTTRKTIETNSTTKGVVNDLSIIEVGPRAADGFIVAGAIAKEQRLGRWIKVGNAKNSLVIFIISRKQLEGLDGLDGVSSN